MNEAVTGVSSPLVLVTWPPGRRDANRPVVPRSFGRASVTEPGGRADGHLPVFVARTGPGISAGRGLLAAVEAEDSVTSASGGLCSSCARGTAPPR